MTNDTTTRAYYENPGCDCAGENHDCIAGTVKRYPLINPSNGNMMLCLAHWVDESQYRIDGNMADSVLGWQEAGRA